MDARLICLPGLALAALSAGCLGTRPALFGPSGMPPPAGAADYAARTTGWGAPGTAAADPLRGSSYATPAAPAPATTAAKPPTTPAHGSGVTPAAAQSAPTPAPLPQPGAVPPGTPAAGGQPNTPGMPGPAALAGVPVAGGMAPSGPHVRATPTAVGGRLGLAPDEVPADRVVELSTQVQAAKFENAALISRIRELEAVAHGREVSLFEAIREVEGASAEVAKARADLATLRQEVSAARDRLRQMEKEDIDTLKAVIAGLEKLLQAPPARPTAGRTP